MPGIQSFLEKVRETLRLKHLNIHTEDIFLSPIWHFIEFHGKHHPKNMPPDTVRQYLTHLAVDDLRRAADNRRRWGTCVRYWCPHCAQWGVVSGAVRRQRGQAFALVDIPGSRA